MPSRIIIMNTMTPINVLLQDIHSCREYYMRICRKTLIRLNILRTFVTAICVRLNCEWLLISHLIQASPPPILQHIRLLTSVPGCLRPRTMSVGQLNIHITRIMRHSIDVGTISPLKHYFRPVHFVELRTSLPVNPKSMLDFCATRS